MADVEVSCAAEGDLDVVELVADDEDAYERFVSAHPRALIYHSLRFRDFVVGLLGCEPTYAVAQRRGEVVGVLPTMSTAGAFGRVSNSLPYFGSNGGTLAASAQAESVLMDWYREHASSPGHVASTLIANPFDLDATPPSHDLVDRRIGCATRLDRALDGHGDGSPEEKVLTFIDGSARRNVAKAARSGIDVAVENDSFGELETLHLAGMDAVGGRTKARAFFEAVPKCFRSGVDFDLFVARLDGEPVAALLIFFYGSVVEYYVPAIAVEHRAEQPMAAILHRAMAEAISRGYSWWNWGGSWVTQENLIRFKAKWGGIPREYHYYTTVNDPTVLSASPDELLDAYPNFYVAPFSSLRPAEAVAGT